MSSKRPAPRSDARLTPDEHGLVRRLADRQGVTRKQAVLDAVRRDLERLGLSETDDHGTQSGPRG